MKQWIFGIGCLLSVLAAWTCTMFAQVSASGLGFGCLAAIFVLAMLFEEMK